MRSTFVKPWCTALSSSFDAPTRPTMDSNTITVVSAARVPARNLCLASAACKTCNDGHILCSSFRLANYGFSSAQKSVIYVYGSHLRKISVLYVKHTSSFWGRGEGVQKEMTRFRFFANIGNYGRPLTGFHWQWRSPSQNLITSPTPTTLPVLTASNKSVLFYRSNRVHESGF